MSISILKRSIFFLTAVLALLACANHQIPGNDEKGPLIHVDKITHTFPPVFEGEELSHTFIVTNMGASNLELKKVTHS